MGKLPARASLALLLVAAWLGADQPNIAPDAVTRATEGYNTHEGEIRFLTDGLHPGNSEAAGAFVWISKGDLTFQFDEVRPVAGLRIYVGADAGKYWATAYRGAFLDDVGQVDTAVAEVAGEASALDMLENTWVDLVFPPEVEADFIELQTERGASFYEVEILQAETDPSAVESVSWGAIKARQRIGD